MERPSCGRTAWKVSGLPNLQLEDQVDFDRKYYLAITNNHRAIEIGSLEFVITSRERGGLCVTYGPDRYQKVVRVLPLPLETN